MPYETLRTIFPAIGWSANRAKEVTFTGSTDPILPTPFRIGVAGAAALAATGLAAMDLWQHRSGRRQSIGVDVRQATASLRSGHYLKVGDGNVSSERNSIMGFYPTRDGRWSYIHANFPNHRAAALEVLGCEESREAVTRIVRAEHLNPADFRFSEHNRLKLYPSALGDFLDQCGHAGLVGFPR